MEISGSKKIAYIISLFLLLPSFLLNSPAYAASITLEYLCEFGITFYKNGRYEEALTEFNKVLMLDSGNKTALKYINSIFERESKNIKPPSPRPSREEAIDNAFAYLGEKQKLLKTSPERGAKKPETRFAGMNISGSTQMGLGVTPDDFIWKRANADLNEKNFRMLSNTAFDRKTNTYDTRIYDSLKLKLETDNQSGFNFYGNITVDPWSFTGKSKKITLAGTGGDAAEIELKYWSNTGYTVNETVFTLKNGDSFALPEIKVKDSKIQTPVSVTSVFNNIFNIPELKIDRQFQPLRELWFDYQQEGVKFRFFPFAYENQALTFDDPLVLSNNHIFWQQSPWIDRWLPGRINPGATPVDFTRGRFDSALSFFARDSEGTRLTALRGFSFEAASADKMSLVSSFASPKDLWQDYNKVDNVINATRLRYRLLDNLSLGALFTYRLGLNENNRKDTDNFLWGTDLGFEPQQGMKVALEAATSRSNRDLATPAFKSRLRGNAYHFSLMGRFPKQSIMDLKYGYNDIKPEKTDTYFAKYRFYLARMDSGFLPALSNYRETRDDAFWSRHIHFRKPFRYYQEALYGPSLSWDDVSPFRIGNGIDIGRDVFGFRLETSLFDRRLDNLFDVRNVHKTNGKFVENAARDEVTYKATDKLTAKVFGIYQRFPKTVKGIDPFIFDTNTGIPLNNQAIVDGQNPSLKTGSLGMEYAFTDWIALSGVWEATNDSTLAYDNFPRGILNSSTFTTFTDDSRVIRREDPFLYSQGLFPLPPYHFFNIWKTGLRLDPMDKLELYLDYTRNEFKSAGQIDDNINHIGFEASYIPCKKLGFFFRYTYARWNDINRMLGGFDKIYLGHHNFFSEVRYLPGVDDEFVLQYGESGIAPISTITYDPFGGGLATLDTRHIVRMYYRRKF